MIDNEVNLEKTFYNDLTPKDVYKNFIIKYNNLSKIRFIFVGLFGFFFKMIVRLNRAIKDPVTGKILYKNLFLLIFIFIFIFSMIIGISFWTVIKR